MKNLTRIKRRRFVLPAVELDTGLLNVQKRNKNPRILARNNRVKRFLVKRRKRNPRTGMLGFPKKQNLSSRKRRRCVLHARKLDTGRHNDQIRNKTPMIVDVNIHGKMEISKLTYRV